MKIQDEKVVSLTYTLVVDGKVEDQATEENPLEYIHGLGYLLPKFEEYLNGKTVDLQAQTIDGTLVNDSDDTVSSWEATINIEGDCFINNAWVGTVEIHQ